MPTDAQDLETASLILGDWAEIKAAPVLPPELVLEILIRHKRASWWTVNTAYSVGDLIVPPTRTGRLYCCTQPGTSQLTTRAYDDWPLTGGLSFYDGTSSPALIWEECGSDSILAYNPLNENQINVYDIISAARECWQKKARISTQFIQTGDLAFQQVHAHCVAMIEKFVPRKFPSRVFRA
jgi:hypothetical protein